MQPYQPPPRRRPAPAPMRRRHVLVGASTAAALLFILLPAMVSAADVLNRVPAPGMAATAVDDPLIDSAFRQSVDLVFRERFEAAMVIIDDLGKQRPHHPAADFMKAAAYQSLMNTYRTNRFTAVMNTHLDAAVEKGNALLAAGEDAWARVFIGAAHGFGALNRFRRGEWMSAYASILNAVDNLQQALEIDPHVYDAYMGIGAYNYWRTARSGFVRSVAFWMADRREIGLAQMGFVVNNGVYSVHETGYNLIAALIDHGRPGQALERVAENIRIKGSAGLIDLYYRGRALEVQNRWLPAAETFGALSVRLAEAPLATAGYRAECRYREALGLYRANRHTEAFAASEAAVDFVRQRDPEREIDSSFEPFSKTLDEILALHRLLEKQLVAASGRAAARRQATPAF
jgi:tetratricopeptide (TPR) repeat protein